MTRPSWIDHPHGTLLLSGWAPHVDDLYNALTADRLSFSGVRNSDGLRAARSPSSALLLSPTVSHEHPNTIVLVAQQAFSAIARFNGITAACWLSARYEHVLIMHAGTTHTLSREHCTTPTYDRALSLLHEAQSTPLCFGTTAHQRLHDLASIAPQTRTA